jgi:hypothetical protein
MYKDKFVLPAGKSMGYMVAKPFFIFLNGRFSKHIEVCKIKEAEDILHDLLPL